MTIQELIDKALQSIGVVESGNSANTTDSNDALDQLNSMMAEWEESGKDINWFPQDTLTDDFPLPRWTENAVIFNLAVNLGVSFQTPVPGNVVSLADKYDRSLTRTLQNLRLKGADMSHLPGSLHRWNIETDI